MGPEDEIYAWKWDGVSIDSIKDFAAQWKLDTLDMVERYFFGGWEETVPAEYRGFIKGPIDEDPSKGENSLAGHQHVMLILAIDSQGSALVQQGVIDRYTDAEGYSLVETTRDGAIGMADQYREAAASSKFSKGMRMG
ncbi:hypothetical protein [Ectopseudomonas mendocina]|jgi:hypothetical protein|uniref:Uncharacterized protein n=1 Tax=Ectopseudomonas mendocina S5.2 TaxID=1225174 RepID=A0ABN4J1J3_ECTME|nr:hypothetical protein [Pseudomonas mendocina]ALN21877.1 hypothetical protein DW68_024680 [Pseudomonas mendocina S5.2]KER98068.1 hypothetical protein HN51_25030 [Pseudomonas mendocina]